MTRAELEEWDRLLARLTVLAEKRRVEVTALKAQGLSLRQIAAQTGISHARVGQLLARDLTPRP